MFIKFILQYSSLLPSSFTLHSLHFRRRYLRSLIEIIATLTNIFNINFRSNDLIKLLQICKEIEDFLRYFFIVGRLNVIKYRFIYQYVMYVDPNR